MKVRTSLSLAFVVFVILALFPCYVLGQDSDPPRCCNAPTGTQGTNVVQSRIVMADSMLATMGMSRAQFVDAMIAVLMPGRQVSVVYSTTISLGAAAVSEVSADGQSPEAVTMTQQFRVPREMMRLEDVNALDQLAITDGVISVAISFRHSGSSVATP